MIGSWLKHEKYRQNGIPKTNCDESTKWLCLQGRRNHYGHYSLDRSTFYGKVINIHIHNNNNNVVVKFYLLTACWAMPAKFWYTLLWHSGTTKTLWFNTLCSCTHQHLMLNFPLDLTTGKGSNRFVAKVLMMHIQLQTLKFLIKFS